MRRKSIWLGIFLTGIALVSGLPAFAVGFVIAPTFTSNFVTNFGANAGAAEAAWISAANVFTSNFSDNITVNITVDAVAGSSVFGQSNTFLASDTYADLYSKVVADAKTPDDFTAIGAGGSVTAADPTGGAGQWWVTRAEAKALGIIPSDPSNDGTTTFGAGNPFTFSGPVAAGTFDFQGIAAHEISEVLGRLGLGGAFNGNGFSLIDLFSYSGAGTRVLGNGGLGGEGSFSIDNGSTLLKKYNDQASNGLDYRDWGPGTNDSFNQFSFSGVTNPVSDVDLREMDVIGYDRVVATPEPSTGILLISGLLLAGGYRRRRKII
jgi:PEP-CTERM motif-containing protein